MSLSIYPLDLGDLELDVSFVNWQTGCGKKSWFPTTAWLIHGAERPILVDSSFRSVEDALSNQGVIARRSSQQTLEYQLGKHGLKSADVGCFCTRMFAWIMLGKICCYLMLRFCCSAKNSKMPLRRTCIQCHSMTG